MDANNDTPNGTRTIKASEFKPKRLQLVNEVADSGGEIVITKNWKLVSRLVPYRELLLQVSLRRGSLWRSPAASCRRRMWEPISWTIIIATPRIKCAAGGLIEYETAHHASQGSRGSTEPESQDGSGHWGPTRRVC